MDRDFRIVFRVDASARIGIGHVMRCLTLAERLAEQDIAIEFVCRLFEGHACDLVENRGFKVHRLPAPAEDWMPVEAGPAHAAWLGIDWEQDAAETFNAIAGGAAPRWMVVDHYGLDYRWESRLRTANTRILTIDDLADRRHNCDILLDQNLVANMEARYEQLVPELATQLIGPNYALLQPDYQRLRPRAAPREGAIRRVLISFGGYDPACLTEQTVAALLELGLEDLEADIVLGSHSSQFARLTTIVASYPTIRLHDRLPSLAPAILAADLAIGASGTTNWERLCLGLPSLVVTVAENQKKITEELERRGLVRWIGDSAGLTRRDLEASLATVFENGLDAEWSSDCMDVVDGRGADRVSAILLTGPDMDFNVRLAQLGDEALLLEWANEPTTRQNAFSQNAIDPAIHKAWFRRRIRNIDKTALYIIETGSGIPFGQVRFDRTDERWEISYAVAPDFRGKGAGRAMLSTAIRTFDETYPGSALVAQVKPENHASARIFAALGFVVKVSEADRDIFERPALKSTPGSKAKAISMT